MEFLQAIMFRGLVSNLWIFTLMTSDDIYRADDN